MTASWECSDSLTGTNAAPTSARAAQPRNKRHNTVKRHGVLLFMEYDTRPDRALYSKLLVKRSLRVSMGFHEEKDSV